MKAKGLISGVLCLAMFGAVPAFAAEPEDIQELPAVGEIGVEFVHKQGYSIQPASQELLEAATLDEIAEVSRRDFEADAEWSSDAAIEDTLELLDEYRAAANNAGELINSDRNVTSSHINSVWSWDWYTA